MPEPSTSEIIGAIERDLRELNEILSRNKDLVGLGTAMSIQSRLRSLEQRLTPDLLEAAKAVIEEAYVDVGEAAFSDKPPQLIERPSAENLSRLRDAVEKAEQPTPKEHPKS